MEVGEAARGIKGFADHETRIQQQQQRARRKLADLDRARPTQSDRRMARGEQIDMLQRTAGEPLVTRIDKVRQILSKMNLAAFQHLYRIEPGRFDQFHLNVGIARAYRCRNVESTLKAIGIKGD